MTLKTFLLIFIPAAVLRLVTIASAPLWYDEAFTWLISHRTIADMLTATAGDVHPPLWYLVTMAITRPGMPYWYIRIPAYLFSLLSMWLFWQVLTRFSIPRQWQTIAMLMMAFMPFQLHFAQEGRVYSLFTCLVLWAVIAVNDGRWVQLFIASALMLWSHNYAVFYLPAVALFGLIRAPRDWWRIALAMAAAALTWVPWLVILLRQMQSISGTYWIDDQCLGEMLDVFQKLFWGGFIGVNGSIFGMGVLITVTGIGVISTRRADLLVLGFAPMLMAIIASALWQPLLLFRGLAGSAPFLYAIIAAPAKDLKLRGLLTYAVFVAPVLILGIASYSMLSDVGKGSRIYPEVFAAIEANYQPGDLIIHNEDGSALNMAVYVSDIQQVKIAGCDPRGALTATTRRALGIDERPLAEVLELAQGRRVFLSIAVQPKSNACSFAQLQPYIAGREPLVIISETEMTYEAVFLIEKFGE